MIVVFTGLPGSGKSAKLARTAIDLLYRNRRYYKKQQKQFAKTVLWYKKRDGGRLKSQTIEYLKILEPKPRLLWTNLKLTTPVEKEFEGFVQYWTDLRQLTPLRDCDVLIDEVATYFDARLWETLSLEMRRWLAQHRKFGIEIYGTSQDFAQVDKAFRRLTSNLVYLTKIMGTRDLSPTRPPPKFVFVLSLVKELDPTVYDEQKSKFQSSGLLPRFMIITKRDVAIFDTRAEVNLSSALPLKHIERVCERNDCPFHKTQHV